MSSFFQKNPSLGPRHVGVRGVPWIRDDDERSGYVREEEGEEGEEGAEEGEEGKTSTSEGGDTPKSEENSEAKE